MKNRIHPFLSRGGCILLCSAVLITSCVTLAFADAQDAKLEIVCSLIEDRLEAMEESGLGHGMTRALFAWMRDTVQISTDKDGNEYIVIASPIFNDSYPGLEKYKGQEPIEFMKKWHATMCELLGAQRKGRERLSVSARTELTAAAFDAWFNAQVRPSMDAWVWDGLNRAKAAGALSRMAFSVQSGGSREQAKQFVKSAQADVYSTKRGTDHASSLMMYLGRASDLEQELVRRWWPVYRGSLRHIEWTAPSAGVGPMLSFSAPRVTFALSEGAKTALVTGYANLKIKREDAAKAVPEYTRDLLINWPEQRFEEMSLTVNLIAFAENGPLDAYLAFGVEPIADALQKFALELEKTNDYFQEYARTHVAPQPYPKTTALLRPASGLSDLKIRNDDAEEALYVRIYRVADAHDTSKGEYVGAMFVRPRQMASISIKPGYYHLNYAQGKSWYGEEHMFGEEGHYISAAENTYCERGYALSITVAPSAKRKGRTAQLDSIGHENM